MTYHLKKALLTAGVCLWLSAAAWGMKWMADYSLTPGRAGMPLEKGPAVSEGSGPVRFTLVMGLHPECPCSRASLAELDSILVESGDAIQAVLIFSDAMPDEPARDSELYRQASALPHTRLVTDTTGTELRHFALQTSGETRLYRADGRLVFCGGITGSRGHVGDNPGRARLLAAMRGNRGASAPANAPVFGCSIE